MWQTVLANMLFKRDQFKLQGHNTIYTMVDEPTIFPAKQQVKLNVAMKNGQRRTLTLNHNAHVDVKFNA